MKCHGLCPWVSTAPTAVGGDKALAGDLAWQVIKLVEERIGDRVPSVEEIQDTVEEVLMTRGLADAARAYILYRQQRADIRRLKGTLGVKDDLKLSINAIKVLERRYLLKDLEGKVTETPTGLFRRVPMPSPRWRLPSTRPPLPVTWKRPSLN